ncbi:MAG: NADP-dependent isocitrate dehydrogenase, partial [Planctomycetota bacterium]|nr:NADP-dependent isocitrate dehydrogenase [Planctomycetota bacterium]
SSRYPSRKVNEIDNRGSSFYLALYWAEALAAQTGDDELRSRFAPIAAALADAEATINSELLAAQGAAVEIGGYFHPSDEACDQAMRPSAALNAIIDGM